MMRFAPKTLVLLSTLGSLFASGALAGTSEPGIAPSLPARHLFRIPKATDVRLQKFKADPAEVALGERLFMESRFAQFFFAHSHGNANAILSEGDPTLTQSATISSQTLPGPYAGLSMNCRVCHMVAEQAVLRRGQRSYADYARRSPVPAREDGKKLTTRNSPPIVNALVTRTGSLFLHNDGEFGSGADLVKATFTGRNFGWLPTEQTQAVHHIAGIIRHDDGKGELAQEFGGYSYSAAFAANSSTIEEDYLIPEEARLDVAHASDGEILNGVARAIEIYMRSLRYSRDERFEYDASPFDLFLEKNKMPRKPAPGQSDRYYIRHLLTLLEDLKEPRYITPADKCFKVLKQDFRFGPRELAGMKIFFSRPAAPAKDQTKRASVGNCVACHTPPHFTDFVFHNTGVSQAEYDGLHGGGAFANLFIPELPERETNYDAWLPPTANHPRASGIFLEIPSRERPGRADLGLWNVFANPDQPAVQAALFPLFASGRQPQPMEALLPRTIALFKTPTLRGLAHSQPYLHTGEKDSLEDVVRFYIKSSTLARAGKLRNGAPELAEIRLQDEDVDLVASFLRSLNEDYE